MPIDRSDPLPIHQFPNLIYEVAKLKELNGRRQAIINRQTDPRFQNHALLEKIEIDIELLRATPALLDVLGMIRAGDAKLLDIVCMIFGATVVAMKANKDPKVQQYIDIDDMLNRYRDLARKMEGKL